MKNMNVQWFKQSLNSVKIALVLENNTKFLKLDLSSKINLMGSTFCAIIIIHFCFD